DGPGDRSAPSRSEAVEPRPPSARDLSAFSERWGRRFGASANERRSWKDSGVPAERRIRRRASQRLALATRSHRKGHVDATAWKPSRACDVQLGCERASVRDPPTTLARESSRASGLEPKPPLVSTC